MPRLITLLLFLLLCTCVRAQTTRIDTVRGPMPGTTAYHFVSEMPASVKMSKAERFMRGIRADQPGNEPWERVDSIVIVDKATGRLLSSADLTSVLRVSLGSTQASRRAKRARIRQLSNGATPSPVYLATDLVILEGKIGAAATHPVRVSNDSKTVRRLSRTDDSERLRTEQSAFSLAAEEELEFTVRTKLPTGSGTYPLVLSQGDSIRLEVRFSLNGHDLSEADFVTEGAAIPTWQVPAGREVLYLRLRSTEKLMTVYADGKVHNKVAVGRQLDELSLVGLAAGDYLLEVVDLGSGQKRYHRLRR